MARQKFVKEMAYSYLITIKSVINLRRLPNKKVKGYEIIIKMQNAINRDNW